MPKTKTRKSVEKRFKVTSTGKVMKRHQLGAGTHRSKKTKGALQRHAKLTEVFKGEVKDLKRALGI